MAIEPAWLGQQVIDVEVGATTSGLWCPFCALPSAGQAHVYVFTADDTVHHIGLFVLCGDCHRFIYPGKEGWNEADHDPG